MHYSNTFYSYYLDQHQWKSLTDFEGDNITPRYFSSIGYLKKNNSVYIFGGMGNESGDQIVGRRYYYDLYKVDLNTKSITKLWEIPWDNENVVPVRGMVILNDSCFYTLCYPEHFTESFLKLYRFSLKDGNYEILGDSIPIYSDKISTNANLYYDNGHLYAVIQESADDITSNLKIYSLLFPPVTAKELKNFPNGQKSDLFILTIILLSFFIAVGIGYLLIKKLKPGAVKDNINAKKLHQTDFKKKTKPNSIYLFGDFTVRDRNNKDITYLFSSKLKQIFCLILQHSTEDGITSQRLSDLLWPGKPSSKVKNSRGVTLNNLRKILDEIDGIEVIYEQGYFKIVQTEDFYCDYSRCMEIISSGDITKHREELVKILSRGTFLKNSDDPLFDSFKEATEQQLEPILLVEMDKSFGTKSYLVTIALAEAIFNIDPLNETALSFLIKAMQKLKRDEEARIKFQTFVIEYKKIMGTH
jgi:two-component SAPR family response regulator